VSRPGVGERGAELQRVFEVRHARIPDPSALHFRQRRRHHEHDGFERLRVSSGSMSGVARTVSSDYDATATARASRTRTARLSSAYNTAGQIVTSSLTNEAYEFCSRLRLRATR
jgi:hypothetical protein